MGAINVSLAQRLMTHAQHILTPIWQVPARPLFWLIAVLLVAAALGDFAARAVSDIPKWSLDRSHVSDLLLEQTLYKPAKASDFLAAQQEHSDRYAVAAGDLRQLGTFAVGLCGLLFIFYSIRVQRTLPLAALTVVLAMALPAAVALFCDGQQRQLLNDAVEPSMAEQVAQQVRLLGIAKFALGAIALGLIFCGLLEMVFALIWLPVGPPHDDPPGTFRSLYLGEVNGSDTDDARRPDTSTPGLSDEPWVTYTPFDHVGLALSGGGIRSATFNLGLLQGFFDLQVLPLVKYLSTVSGGGYIGGWWTAWLRNRGTAAGSIFPTNPAAPGPVRGDMREADAVRHLREFSMFLSPRWGILEVEMWNGVVAILTGTALALTAGTIVVLGVIGLGLVLGLLLWGLPTGAAVAGVSVVTFAVLWFFEAWWNSVEKSESQNWRLNTIEGAAILVALPTVVVAIVWNLLAWLWPGAIALPEALWLDKWPKCCSFFDALGSQARILFPCAVWLIAAAILIAFRVVLSRSASARELRGPVDRVLGRVLALAGLWFGASVMWLLARYASSLGMTEVRAGIGALTSSAAFALLRNSMFRFARKPATPTVGSFLARWLPPLIAYLTLFLVGVFLTSIVAARLQSPRLGEWMILVVGCPIIIYLLCFVWDSETIGLHSFYSDRIARAYLGASNPDATNAANNRHTDRRRHDDFVLSSLAAPGVQQPIHLICCTANRLADDPLGTLGRGARSAVLSCFGVSVGDCWGPHPNLSMSSALTASAAAFNSNMGSVSRRLGPAVTFLMSALNLRLGLWVPHPARRRSRPQWLPGLLFFREMFQQTSCTTRQVDGVVRAVQDDVHLSDGAHFENLGLYELVRRHCRYIIVSDCGEDVTLSFDDFGNAVRRIREDFGVEIEIDVSPLRSSADGYARQHCVVGTIHYDRGKPGQMAGPGAAHATPAVGDKGILLYFKPGLTGDEPDDVCQYKVRNAAFPHESTVDQFYDEAQWEAYRRLGEHAARSSLSYLEQNTQPVNANYVFSAARERWYPTPADLCENLTALAERYSELQRHMATRAPRQLMNEMFPEAGAIQPPPASGPMTNRLLLAGLHWILQITQLIEDVILGCHLDTHGNHPLNLGWANLFQRWASTPTFRRWWPVIKPLYGTALRTYVDHRLLFAPLPSTTPGVIVPVDPAGLAMTAWQRNPMAVPPLPADSRAYRIDLTAAAQIQVAMVFYTIDTSTAHWDTSHFFIVPGLWGTEIGVGFLRALLEDLKTREHVQRCIVHLRRPHGATSMSSELYTDLAAFYMGCGFRPSRNRNELIRDL